MDNKTAFTLISATIYQKYKMFDGSDEGLKILRELTDKVNELKKEIEK